jgi:hypothetical protein
MKYTNFLRGTALAATLLATSARADVLSVTADGWTGAEANYDNGGFDSQTNGTLFIAKFAPSLGTLTGVHLTLVNPYFDASASVHGDNIAGARVTFSYFVTVAGLSLSNSFGTSCDSPECAQTDSVSNQGVFGQTAEDLTDLGDFIGAGDLIYEASDMNMGTSGGCGPGNGEGCSIAADATFYTGLEIDYTFTPADVGPANPVPEPGSVALLAVGCLGVGGALVSRKRVRLLYRLPELLP